MTTTVSVERSTLPTSIAAATVGVQPLPDRKLKWPSLFHKKSKVSCFSVHFF